MIARLELNAYNIKEARYSVLNDIMYGNYTYEDKNIRDKTEI